MYNIMVSAKQLISMIKALQDAQETGDPSMHKDYERLEEMFTDIILNWGH